MGEPILSAGSILNGIGTNAIAGGNPITGALLNASILAGSGGGGGSFIGGGFEPSISGIGQGITEAFKAPIFGQGGTLSNIGQAAGAYNQVNQMFGGQQHPMQMPSAMQVQRGQVQPMDYMSLLNPQQQTVLRPQPISLL